jgi:hypothetical protein
MGSVLVHEIPGFIEYRIEDIINGLSEQSEGWTCVDDEYPHYAFYLDGANFDSDEAPARTLRRAELSVPARRHRADLFSRSVGQSIRALLLLTVMMALDPCRRRRAGGIAD